MSDIRDARLWCQRISTFKDFADSVGAEFEMRRLENGKEYVAVKQFYRPEKERKDGSKS